MTREPLSRLDDWELEHEDQDIRGWPVQDEAGNRVGTVEEMIVDTDEGYVDAIVLDNGAEYPTGDIVLRDGLVFLRTPDVTEEARIQRTEEELRAGTREREVGSIKIRKRVQTEHERVEVPKRREEVHIDRVPVEGEASEAEIGDEEIRVPVTEEEVVVEKRPVAKEEVRIRKETVEDEEVVEEDVRKEEIDVEDDTQRRGE